MIASELRDWMHATIAGLMIAGVWFYYRVQLRRLQCENDYLRGMLLGSVMIERKVPWWRRRWN